MTSRQTVRIGRRGTLVIPSELRRQYGLEEGAVAVIEARPDGVLVRPATAVPVEIYTDERKAEFLLSNATDEDDYKWACDQVRELGLDPDRIPHRRPTDR